MLSVLNIVLVTSVVLLGYTWVGYPFLLAVAARLFGRRPPTSDLRSPSEASAKERSPISDLPHLHIICSAYNEAEVIGQRLENLAGVDYPADRISIYIGTDGCTDDTADIVRGFGEEASRAKSQRRKEESGELLTYSLVSGLTLCLDEFTENRGKPAVLKDLVAAAMQRVESRPDSPTSDLLVFTDANTYYAPDALHQLVKPFSDPAIGGVCGRVILHGKKAETGKLKAEKERVREDGRNDTPHAISAFSFQSSALPPEGSYWEFETKLKIWESSLDSCLGANGPLYAIRPELFWNELPPNTVVDDLVIAMKVREQGKRMLFEPKALSYEELPETKDEWWRRVRIGSGDYQAISFCRRCLLPSYGWFSWAFWSHKVLRWFTPHLMLCTAVVAIIGSTLARSQGAGVRSQVLICDIVSAGSLAAVLLWGAARAASSLRPPTSGLRLPVVGAPLRLLDHFCTMQLALFCGFIRFCRGELKGSWRRTPR